MVVELIQREMGAGVRSDADPRGGQPAQFLPAGQRRVAGPPRSSSHLGGGHEQLGVNRRMGQERLHAVTKAVISGDDIGPGWQIRRQPVVKRPELLRGEGGETQPAEQSHLSSEAAGREIKPLLARPELSGQPVVVEHDVGAGGETPPLGARRRVAGRAPEDGIHGQGGRPGPTPPGQSFSTAGDGDQQPAQRTRAPGRLEPAAQRRGRDACWMLAEGLERHPGRSAGRTQLVGKGNSLWHPLGPVARA